MKIVKENTITTVCGRKGSGKTYMCHEIMEMERRVFVLDTTGDYGDGATVVWGRDDCIRAMVKADKMKKFRLALRVMQREEMLDLLELAWECPETYLIIEETSMLCSATSLPDQLATLVRYGRHRAISQIYITRRPAELPRDLTAQSDIICTFQQGEPRDLEYLRGYGFDSRAVAGLPKYRVAVRLNTPDVRVPLPIQERIHQRDLLTAEPEPDSVPPVEDQPTPEPSDDGPQQ